MSALKLNGIDLDEVIAAAGDDLKPAVRDVGMMGEAVDGSAYLTRSARKLDLSCKTVPLSLADARAWMDFFAGEGEVWSFDSSLYGSKGTGPFSVAGTAVQSAGGSKYGAGKLSMGASSVIAWAGVGKSLFNVTTAWTVALWRNAGSWTHYVINSSGQKWVDGVRNDAASTSFAGMSSGDFTLTNSSGTVLYDDLVVVPFVMPTGWPPQIYAAAAAFGPLPRHALTGDFVLEQATRLVLGTAKDGGYLKTGGGTMLQTLDVELKAV